jgi:hypothetical protein
LADPKVAVTAKANPEYTAHKFGDGQPVVETYVFMQGSYFEGHTVDQSIERMPFQSIALYLGTELARQNYLPARSVADAQLLIVVHWGTTIPRVTSQEMSGQYSLIPDMPGAAGVAAEAMANPSGEPPPLPPAPDTSRSPEANDTSEILSRLTGNVTQGNAARLLGYTDEIHRLSKKAWSGTKDEILNFHLNNERYFITLIAYDLKGERAPGHSRRPVWSLHLNISSPGNNFQTALDRISAVAPSFAGRTTDGMESIRPKARQGTVTIAPFVILGDVKPGSK